MLPNILEITQEIINKKPIIIVDSPDRENEGDIVMAAEDCNPKWVNFMASHGKGLICVPIVEETALRLKLNPMVEINRDNYRTAFTVSVDSTETTTGISAFDRYRTIQKIADPHSTELDFRKPGHIFPLLAKSGGVLERAGHTEASIDIIKLANKKPTAVICEILKEDGTMARMDDLVVFAKKFQLKICTIESLIQYRIQRENLLKEILSTNAETIYGDFTIKVFQNAIDGKKHIAIVKGDIDKSPEPVYVRVHTESLLEDVFGVFNLSNSFLVRTTLEFLQKQKRGVFVYLLKENQEYAFLHKLKIYEKNKENQNSKVDNQYDKNPTNQNPKNKQADVFRDYGIGAQILCALNVKSMILITNNPKYILGLESYNLNIIETISI